MSEATAAIGFSKVAPVQAGRSMAAQLSSREPAAQKMTKSPLEKTIVMGHSCRSQGAGSSGDTNNCEYSKDKEPAGGLEDWLL